MDLRARHWALAAIGAVALHASASVLFWASAEDGPADAPGLNGLAVSLGPAGSMPGMLQPAAEAPEELMPASSEVVQAEAVEPAEALPTETVPDLLPADPVPVVESAEAVLPEPEPVSVPEVAEVVPQPLPAQAEVLPEPPPAKPQPPVQVAEAPAPSEEPVRQEPVQQALAPLPGPVEPEPAETITGNQGAGGSTELQGSGDGDATPGGGLAGASGDYGATLTAWIQKYHKFSRRLERRKLYGTAVVSFTIDRDGNLLDYEIVQSSGHELIDEAAIETLKRASPMPPVPNELPGARYTPLPLPIEFNPPS